MDRMDVEIETREFMSPKAVLETILSCYAGELPRYWLHDNEIWSSTGPVVRISDGEQVYDSNCLLQVRVHGSYEHYLEEAKKFEIECYHPLDCDVFQEAVLQFMLKYSP